MNIFKSDIFLFLLKIAGIYLLWYLVYELWLLPDGSLDHWVAVNIAHTTAGLLEALGYNSYVGGRLIGINESAGVFLVDGCTGISAIGLFIGFVLAYPGRWIPRIAFIIIGVGIIYLVNLLRVGVLAVTQVAYPEFFDFTHDYSTTAIFYFVIFFLWVIWANMSNAGFENSTEKGQTESITYRTSGGKV